ncbi:hypothetical protein V6N11_063252 [Hibiscus sabdariffa]|uniref:RNase H type-1 domain-containing protein n=1 Tax=Hibiscus sabdariffa TaxID=183260 RepID=A0ABR1ZP90_9ROSI
MTVGISCFHPCFGTSGFNAMPLCSGIKLKIGVRSLLVAVGSRIPHVRLLPNVRSGRLVIWDNSSKDWRFSCVCTNRKNNRVADALATTVNTTDLWLLEFKDPSDFVLPFLQEDHVYISVPN